MSYIDAIQAARDKPAELTALIEAASLILYRFTEEKEDWSAYRALHEALSAFVIEPTIPREVRFKLIVRLDEYEERLYGLN